MPEGLYRQEAMDEQAGGFANPVRLNGSLSASVIIAFALTVIGALLVYGYKHEYARKITVSGYVSPASGSLILPAPASGQLKVSVQNGQSVAKGDLLAVIHDRREGDAAKTDSEMRLDALSVRLALLQQRGALIEDRTRTGAQTHRARNVALSRQMDILLRSTAVLRQQSEIVAARLSRTEILHERGLVTEEALDAVVAEHLEVQHRLIGAEASVEELDAARARLENDRRAEMIALEAERIDIADQSATIGAEIARVEASRRVALHAPRDGIVTLARARDLEEVVSGEALFSIDGTGDAFRAVLLAPSSAIGFLSERDEFSIRYAAFPWREHGIFTGRVIDIDKAALVPGAIDAPIATDEPVYRVTAEIDQNPVSKQGDALRLASGMLLEASVLIDRKPILLWLFDPVI